MLNNLERGTPIETPKFLTFQVENFHFSENSRTQKIFLQNNFLGALLPRTRIPPVVEFRYHKCEVSPCSISIYVYNIHKYKYKNKIQYIINVIYVVINFWWFLPSYSGKQTVKGTCWIFDRKISVLFKKRTKEVFANHLLLQIESNNTILSCMRF